MCKFFAKLSSLQGKIIEGEQPMKKLKRTNVQCGLMRGCGNKETGTIYCDTIGWEIRKNYPKDFECCSKDGRCMGRNEGNDMRVQSVECMFREECFNGARCDGPQGQYCTLKEIKGEEAIKLLKQKIDKNPNGKKKDILESQVTLIQSSIAIMASA